MKKSKSLVTVSLLTLFTLASCSVSAIKGEKGDIGPSGTQGEAGHSPQITIGSNGNWFIDGVDQNVKAGATDEVYNDTLPDKAAGLSFTLSLTLEGYFYCVSNILIDNDTEGIFIPKSFKGIPVNSISIPDTGFVGEDGQLKWIHLGNNIKYLNVSRLIDVVDEVYYDGTISDWCHTVGDFIETKKFYKNNSSGDIEFNGNKYELCSSITIPGDVTKIRTRTFNHFSCLESVIIEEGVKEIDFNAFMYCTNLKNISIPNSVDKLYNYSSFNTNNNLIFNELNNGYYLGNSNNPYLLLVKTKNDNFTSFNIDSGCRFISSYAFSGRNITSIVIPDNVISLERGSFENCEELGTVLLPNTIKTIGEYCFGDCIKLSTINVPQGCEELGDGSFYCCKNLETITLPSSLKSIESSAFNYCTSLSEITLSEGLETIEDNAFAYTAITSITIPSTVTSIGGSIFNNCNSLSTINYNGTKTQWADIYKNSNWNRGCSVTEVVCTDGNISLI